MIIYLGKNYEEKTSFEQGLLWQKYYFLPTTLAAL